MRPTLHTDLTAVLHHILVGGDTSGLESLRRQHLLLTGDQMNAVGELSGITTTLANLKGTDLGIGNTTAETRLRVGLVLAVAVALSRTATHYE